MRYALIISVLLASSSAWARADKKVESLSADEHKQLMQDTIKEYLATNPELLVEVLQKYAQEQQTKQLKAFNERMQAKIDKLLDPKTAVVVGNPNASKQLVVFYDANCPHCRNLDKALHALPHRDDLAVFYRFLPVTGNDSVELAASLIAAEAQGKFIVLKNHISNSHTVVSPKQWKEMAKKYQVDMRKLEATLKTGEPQAQLKANIDLAKAVEAPGTPTVVLITDGKSKLLYDLNPAALQKALQE